MSFVYYYNIKMKILHVKYIFFEYIRRLKEHDNQSLILFIIVLTGKKPESKEVCISCSVKVFILK